MIIIFRLNPESVHPVRSSRNFAEISQMGETEIDPTVSTWYKGDIDLDLDDLAKKLKPHAKRMKSIDRRSGPPTKPPNFISQMSSHDLQQLFNFVREEDFWEDELAYEFSLVLAWACHEKYKKSKEENFSKLEVRSGNF